MLRHLWLLSRDEAEKFVPRSTTAAISVTDPGELITRLHCDIRRIHRVQFVDASENGRGLPRGFLPDMGMGPNDVRVDGEIWPDAFHASQIALFALALAHDRDHFDVLVHCEAGRSRSAAIADYLLRFYQLPLVGTRTDLAARNQRLSRLLTRVHTGRPLTQFGVSQEAVEKERERRRLKKPRGVR